ncbi:MAG TPA: hypothetical protein VNZ52_08705 [Candidatus Thermoplasmatota archaeon]|nr:hypothetical protein [Candidatus Thermoplasmatota archaeon]
MAGIFPLQGDFAAVVAGPRERYTFRRGALEMLLDPPEGLRKTKVPLQRTPEVEGGAITISKTGRTLMVETWEPRKLFVCKADDVRLLLKGKLNAVNLTDVTEPE